MAASFGCSHVRILEQCRNRKNSEFSYVARCCVRWRTNFQEGFDPMFRIYLAIAMAALLSACADNTTSHHHGAPPQDPPDYHGVPTDDRPPTMIENLPPAQ
jgi:hypothetical protein